MKDDIGGKIMKEIFRLTAKTYSYLMADGSEGKKAEITKKCVIKITFQFEDYKNCLGATELENKIDNLEKSKVNVDNLQENHK